MTETPGRAQKARPNLRQRRVAQRLKMWRSNKGLKQEQLAKQLMWSQSRVAKLESCATIAGVSDVIAIATILGIPEAERDHVAGFARSGAENEVWWRDIASAAAVPDYAHDFLETEALAASVRILEQIVPGLLQSRSYTDELLRPWMTEPDDAVIEERRRLRSYRQTRLDDPKKLLHVEAIIPEHEVLRKLVGNPAVMVEQLDLLIERAPLPNVAIYVIPRERGAWPGIGKNYNLLSFQDADTEKTEALYLENLASGVFVEEPSTVGLYRANHERLIVQPDPPAEGWTLNPEASLQRMIKIRDDWAAG